MAATPVHLVNPFFFEHPADRWSFTDREDLVPKIKQLMDERGRRVLFYGRRRMGKSSLIENATAKDSRRILKADLSQMVGLTEAATRLLNQLPKPPDNLFARLVQLAEEKLDGVSISIWKFAFKADLRPPESQTNLGKALDFINAVAETEDVIYTVWLDEFQELWKLGGEDSDWKLRAVSQGHRHINYFFSGSDHRLLRRMTDPKAAFFKQLQTIEVKAIDPAHLAQWIDSRIKQGGLPGTRIGADLVAAAGPCTGDIVRLAKTAFELLAAEKQPADVAARAFDQIALWELNHEHAAYWRQMTGVQRAVLRAIAAGEAPQANETVMAYGIGSPSNAASAIHALLEEQHLTRSPSGRGVMFDSPFFRRWVAANAPVTLP